MNSSCCRHITSNLSSLRFADDINCIMLLVVEKVAGWVIEWLQLLQIVQYAPQTLQGPMQ